VTCCGTDLLCA